MEAATAALLMRAAALAGANPLVALLAFPPGPL